jgi:hypothetical protein
LSFKNRDWIEILTANDNEALWSKLCSLIAKHSSIRLLYSHDELTGGSRHEIFSDLTQDLFLRLLEKNRWQYYLDNGYTSEHIEQELNRMEVPNYISVLQRDRYPEAYRLARRISKLIKTRREFRLYSTPSHTDRAARNESARASRKMVLQVYGLSWWPVDRPARYDGDLLERVKDVPCRRRDVRRMGRGEGAQVVISNEELLQLIVDIFVAVDRPLAVRQMRALVMSKLAIEDSRLVSLDATLPGGGEETPVLRLELPDDRPTPLDALLAKEAQRHIELIAETLLKKLREAVRNKPARFHKLVHIAWRCYFDPASPSQGAIARELQISDSLVSHYRAIFDTFVQNLNLCLDDYILLNSVLGNHLAALKSESGDLLPKSRRSRRQRKESLPLPVVDAALPMSMAATRSS